jgi:metallophosphoesterase (TIGR00282 family)
VSIRILFIGDIVGKGGRRAVTKLIPELRNDLGFQFCVANAENAAGGGGITRKCLDEMRPAVVDVFTGGDHIWDQHDFATEIGLCPNVLRPANVYSGQPGRGYGVFPLPGGGGWVGVVSLLGRTFMNGQTDCPFQAADRIAGELQATTRCILVDFHAEATSEKTALARFLDGRVSAVLGTHTHVPTADEQILPGGTAFQCDVGMVGSRESILGRAVLPVVQRFSTGMPARFAVEERHIRLHATLVSIDSGTGRATAIERVVRDLPEA